MGKILFEQFWLAEIFHIAMYQCQNVTSVGLEGSFFTVAITNTNNQSNMLNSEFHPKQNINISLEQLKENLPRTPYDHATWLEDFYQKEK